MKGTLWHVPGALIRRLRVHTVHPLTPQSKTILTGLIFYFFCTGLSS